MEEFCTRCRHHEEQAPLRRTKPPFCPQCNAWLSRRVGEIPGPANRFVALLRTVFSPTWVVLMLLIALLTTFGFFWTAQKLGVLMLYISAVKLAWSAMNTRGGKIAVPSLMPQDFTQNGGLGSVIFYVVVFMFVPLLLTGLGAATVLGGGSKAQRQAGSVPYEYDPREESAHQNQVNGAVRSTGRRYDYNQGGSDWAMDQPAPGAYYYGHDDTPNVDTDAVKRAMKVGEEQRLHVAQKEVMAKKMAANAPVDVGFLGISPWVGWAALILAVLLIFYSAMALMLFLATNTVSGMFDLGAAYKVFQRDFFGYLGLTSTVLLINGLRMFGEPSLLQGKMAGAFAASFVKVALTFLVYGLCGLFVRKHARTLDVACDEDDWEPYPAAPGTAPEFIPGAPTPRQPPRPRAAPLEVEGWTAAAPVAPVLAKQHPAPLEVEGWTTPEPLPAPTRAHPAPLEVEGWTTPEAAAASAPTVAAPGTAPDGWSSPQPMPPPNKDAFIVNAFIPAPPARSPVALVPGWPPKAVPPGGTKPG